MVKTLNRFSYKLENVPAATSWYLADLGEAKGKQELFTKQSPQKLKVLREHALIESAVSSNRIEGIEIDKRRIATVVFGKALLKDRGEEEVRGYRDALNLIHEHAKELTISEKTILQFHKLTRGEVWDAGKFKEKDGDIIEKYPDGRERIRFKTVSASETPAAVRELSKLWNECLQDAKVHPLILLAAFNLDFLCIHPFRDGNGRVSRILLLLQCYHLGFEVGRYISIERLIEQHKERYYETLEESSKGWHDGKHDPWPYINFILFILKQAYREFEGRVGMVGSPKGTKTEIVKAAIEKKMGAFTLSGLERECPGVSRDMIRRVLRDLQKARKIKCVGKGPGASWVKKG